MFYFGIVKMKRSSQLFKVTAISRTDFWLDKG